MRNNEELVKYLIMRGILQSSTIIDAFSAIDRKDFVPNDLKDQAYVDEALLIGENATISQPSTLSFMIELLNPRVGESILDFGSGSCWSSAILAELVGDKGKVYGVEINPDVLDFGIKNISKYNFNNVEFFEANSSLGLPEYGPYDKILVSAGFNSIPQALINQLSIGGVMVIPIDLSLIKVIKIAHNYIEKEEYEGFTFVSAQ